LFALLQARSYSDFIGSCNWSIKGLVIDFICSSIIFTWPFLILYTCVQVLCAVILLLAEGSLKKQFSNWSLVGSLTASGLPAAIYALQNSLLQISYKNLDSLTFSILNQTKLLFTAFFTYLILGYVLLIPVLDLHCVKYLQMTVLKIMWCINHEKVGITIIWSSGMSSILFGMLSYCKNKGFLPI
jgi:hypothetical protein